MRWIWAAVLVSLVAAACGSGGGSQPVESEQGADVSEGDAQPVDSAGLELVIGSVMPETGSLAFFGVPLIASVELAVNDIRAAGGNVRLLTGDSATDPDVAPETVNRLLGEGADVIVGASASGVSQSFIQTLYDAQIPQCAPSNTSTSFSTQANAGYYFRTVAPDVGVAPLLANVVAEGGATNVSIVARADDWGNSLAELLKESFDGIGLSSQIFSYDEDASSFDSTVTAALSIGADTVVILAFSEGAQIIRSVLEAGVPPTAVYATDALFDLDLPEKVDPSNPNVIDGMMLTAIGGGSEYNARLGELTDGSVLYGGQAYDCVVVLALAALAAGTTDGTAIIGEVQNVTGGGQKCFSYAECAELVSQGVDIDYDGVSGPLELNEVGDPTFGRYLVLEYIDGEPTEIAGHDVNLSHTAASDFELVIGRILPETGMLSTLSSPMIIGVELAIGDIQEAGGRVRLLAADSATDPDVAPEAVSRLLGEGAHVIVGASASGVSQSFIQMLYDAQIPQCSPSNTSPSFSTQANAAYYFRTVPPDQAVSLILAGIVAADGATNVAIPARADDWGNALSQLMEENLEALGVNAEVFVYDEDATSYDPTVEAVEAMSPDAVVLVTFAEGAQIVRGLLEAGIPPTAMYSSDGLYDVNLAAAVDPDNPNVIDGLVAAAAGGSSEFSQRLIDLADGNVIYGGQAYDCVVVLALAALAAGTTSGPAIIEQVGAVTSGGQKCFDYRECAGLLEAGVDIDYDGVSGPLALNEVGDPTFGRFLIVEFADGAPQLIDSQDVDLAKLE